MLFTILKSTLLSLNTTTTQRNYRKKINYANTINDNVAIKIRVYPNDT